jgi:hypothetical protein
MLRRQPVRRRARGSSIVAAGRLELLFERCDRLIEHAPMRIGSRGIAIRAGFGARKLKRPAAVRAVTLFRRQRTPERFLPLRFGLLVFDVFALEASSHSPVF